LARILGHTKDAHVSVASNTAHSLSVRTYGTRREDMLAPEPDGPPTGAEFIREYFLRPEKFCFFEVNGFGRALHGSRAREATVTIRFDASLPNRSSLGKDALRAHCAPAVNLFRTTSEPRIFGSGTSSFPVRVAGLPSAQSSVYAILGATATLQGAERAPAIPLSPLRRFGAGHFSEAFPYAYSTRLVGPRGREQLVLSLTNPRGSAPLLSPHVISLDLLATNGACSIRPGELSEPGLGMPPGLRVRNLVSASPYVPAPAGAELARHVFTRSEVPDSDPLFALKSLLFSLVPLRGSVDAATVASYRARIDGIESMRVVGAYNRSQARRGYAATFTLDETPFRGIGDVALFLRLLQRTLDAQTSVNSFYRCEAVCRKSGVRLRWPGEGA